jgi:hypothetical protein
MADDNIYGAGSGGITALTGGLGSLIGAIIGNGNANNEEEAIQLILHQAGDDLGKINPAKLEALKAEQMGPSAAEGFTQDKNAVDAQLGALRHMQGVASNKGWMPEDRARYNDMRNQVSGEDQARRQSILQNAQMRGIGGSGIELANQLAGASMSADRLSNQAFDVNAEASRRALQAAQQSGQFGGQMRSQNADEQFQKFGAMDRVSQFNTGLRQDTNLRNQDMEQQRFKNDVSMYGERQKLRDAKIEERRRRAERARTQGEAYGSAAGTMVGGFGEIAAGKLK